MQEVRELHSYIWLIDETLTDTVTPGQSEPGNNGNGGVLDTPQISRTEAFLSDAV